MLVLMTKAKSTSKDLKPQLCMLKMHIEENSFI